jgi:hypothetical protein
MHFNNPLFFNQKSLKPPGLVYISSYNFHKSYFERMYFNNPLFFNQKSLNHQTSFTYISRYDFHKSYFERMHLKNPLFFTQKSLNPQTSYMYTYLAIIFRSPILIYNSLSNIIPLKMLSHKSIKHADFARNVKYQCMFPSIIITFFFFFLFFCIIQ